MYYFIVLGGTHGVGVEGISARFAEDRMTYIPTTLGGPPGRRIEIYGKEIVLYLQEDYTGSKGNMVSRFLLRGSSRGLMAIYDITSRESYEKAKGLVIEAREENEEIKVILVGNKCDLDDKREVSYEEALSFSKEEGILFNETSALESINIKESFHLLAREIFLSESKPLNVDITQDETRSSRCF